MDIEKFFLKSNLIENICNLFYSLIGKEKINNFEDKLFLNNFLTKNFQTFIIFSTFLGAIFSIFTSVALFYLGIEIQKTLIFSILNFFTPFLIFYLIQDVMFERNKRKKEDLLPELLLEISVLVDQMSLIKLIEEISKMDFPLLNKDFEFIHLQIKNGEDPSSAINKIKKMNKSSEMSRFFEIFLQGYYSGSELNKLLNELAEEMLQNRAIIKERQAVMLVTKYTLLLASVLIVPIILGLIVSLVNGFNISFSNNFEIGLSKIEREELFNLAVLGVQIYIIEYSLISSFFLAMQDGNKKNFFIYCVFLTPLAIIFFFIGTIL